MLGFGGVRSGFRGRFRGGARSGGVVSGVRSDGLGFVVLGVRF